MMTVPGVLFSGSGSENPMICLWGLWEPQMVAVPTSLIELSPGAALVSPPAQTHIRLPEHPGMYFITHI
jgi:hypothetical protein